MPGLFIQKNVKMLTAPDTHDSKTNEVLRRAQREYIEAAGQGRGDLEPTLFPYDFSGGRENGRWLFSEIDEMLRVSKIWELI